MSGFQSTRPRGARQRNGRDIHASRWVSIHAPTWGATVLVCEVLRAVEVSIHAPTWGATCRHHRCMPMSCCFNPRAHVGRDVGGIANGNLTAVSIHAPTWGATRESVCLTRLASVSIHAPTWGATLKFSKPVLSTPSFQSTRPRGARLQRHRLLALCERFNPRAHVGRDLSDDEEMDNHIVFQSTRPRGARLAVINQVKLLLGFNPRAHVGRDCPH